MVKSHLWINYIYKKSCGWFIFIKSSLKNYTSLGPVIIWWTIYGNILYDLVKIDSTCILNDGQYMLKWLSKLHSIKIDYCYTFYISIWWMWISFWDNSVHHCIFILYNLVKNKFTCILIDGQIAWYKLTCLSINNVETCTQSRLSIVMHFTVLFIAYYL